MPLYGHRSLALNVWNGGRDRSSSAIALRRIEWPRGGLRRVRGVALVPKGLNVGEFVASEPVPRSTLAWWAECPTNRDALVPVHSAAFFTSRSDGDLCVAERLRLAVNSLRLAGGFPPWDMFSRPGRLLAGARGETIGPSRRWCAGRRTLQVECE